MSRIIAFTGLPMTGKSTARGLMQAILDERSIEQTYVHFGSTEEVERRDAADDWPEEEKHLTQQQKEGLVREQWRRDRGMGVMAEVKLQEIKSALDGGKLVLIDNIGSYEESIVLRNAFGQDTLLLVALVADWPTRVRRGRNREYRPMNEQELRVRDQAEACTQNRAPNIALSDITIVNNMDEQADPEAAKAEIRSQLIARVLPYAS